MNSYLPNDPTGIVFDCFSCPAPALCTEVLTEETPNRMKVVGDM